MIRSTEGDHRPLWGFSVEEGHYWAMITSGLISPEELALLQINTHRKLPIRKHCPITFVINFGWHQNSNIEDGICENCWAWSAVDSTLLQSSYTCDCLDYSLWVVYEPEIHPFWPLLLVLSITDLHLSSARWLWVRLGSDPKFFGLKSLPHVGIKSGYHRCRT